MANERCPTCKCIASAEGRKSAKYKVDWICPDAWHDQPEPAAEKCPQCGGAIISTAHGLYCPKPTCKWGWEVELDGSPLKPAQPAPDEVTAEQFWKEVWSGTLTSDGKSYRNLRDNDKQAFQFAEAYARSRTAALEKQLAQWESWGIVEIASRNPSIADYCKHWEGRAEKAERENRELRARLQSQEANTRLHVALDNQQRRGKVTS